MVPSKVEITLRKADQVSWGKLEDPNYKPEPEPEEEPEETNEAVQPDWDIDDDDISESDEEWVDNTPANKSEVKKDENDLLRERLEEMQRLQMKQVQEDMKKAMEKRKKTEEEKEKQKEQDMEEGFEEMPDLE